MTENANSTSTLVQCVAGYLAVFAVHSFVMPACWVWGGEADTQKLAQSTQATDTRRLPSWIPCETCSLSLEASIVSPPVGRLQWGDIQRLQCCEMRVQRMPVQVFRAAGDCCRSLH